MNEQQKSSRVKAIDELQKKIVHISYSEQPKAGQENKSVDKAKIVELARKIRETYDYSDTALDGAH